LHKGETQASSVDSLSNEDGGAHSLLPIMGIDHSLSPFLGLALVALVLTLHGTVEGMTTSFVVGNSCFLWGNSCFLWGRRGLSFGICLSF